MRWSAFTMAERVKMDATEAGWRMLQQRAKWNTRMLWLAPVLWILYSVSFVAIDLAGLGRLQPTTVPLLLYIGAVLGLLATWGWQYTRLRLAAAAVVRELQAQVPMPPPPGIIITRPGSP